jgi:hypothetical protein
LRSIAKKCKKKNKRLDKKQKIWYKEASKEKQQSNKRKKKRKKIDKEKKVW